MFPSLLAVLTERSYSNQRGLLLNFAIPVGWDYNVRVAATRVFATGGIGAKRIGNGCQSFAPGLTLLKDGITFAKIRSRTR